MIDKQPQNVDFLPLVNTGKLYSGNNPDPVLFTGTESFLYSVYRIVIRQRNGSQSGSFCFCRYLGRGKRAVRGGGMDMEINIHELETSLKYNSNIIVTCLTK